MHKCDCNLNVITRRSFLDRSLKTSAAVALSTLVDIPLVMKQALAEGTIGLNGKKVLFLWLRGANDSLNSVIPILDPAYATSRPSLKLPTDVIDYSAPGPADFPVSGAASTYGAYPFAVRLGNGFAALHPSLKFLAPVYNAGDLALIHRVAYPRQSRSHFDSQRYWENGNPNNNIVQDGIFYRTILESGLAHTAPLTGVSIQSSLPLLLRGSEAAMTNLTDPLRYDLLGVPNSTNGNYKASAFLNQANTFPFPPKRSRGLLELQYENLSNTLDIFASLNFTDSGNTFRDDEITDGDTEWAANHGGEGYYLFPANSNKNGGWLRNPSQPATGTNIRADKYVVPTSLHSLFDRLKAAALILNKTDAIIAGTEYGGFDTHQTQGTLTGSHPDLNRGFGWAMSALRKYFTRYADKATWNDIVVLTLSEFGRTTIENSDLGTDHAEAGVMLAAGGAINGYDSLAGRSGVFNCGPSDPVPWVIGPSGSMFGVNGRYLKRATDYRQVLGEIIRKHLGATQAQLNRIIPGYANPAENLLAGGPSIDGIQIRGELGLL
jgi:uncharacterized protein (DUF1501 family)